jgi:hypothetical protein
MVVMALILYAQRAKVLAGQGDLSRDRCSIGTVMASTPDEGRTSPLALDQAVLDALQATVPAAAARTVAAVTEEVVEYAGARGTEMGANIERAVEMALGAFWRRATGTGATEGEPTLAATLDAAYGLGRGEAQTGRSVESLLAAYRVGARVSWRELSTALVDHDVPAATVARLAELVFAYIDELSAASVSGHGDELARSGRVREQHRERLGHALLTGEPPERLAARAARADWTPPESVTVVVLPSVQLRAATGRLDPRTLVVPGDVIGPAAPEETTALVVPDAHRRRDELRHALAGRGAVVGPSRAWTEAAASYRRAVRAMELLPPPDDEPLDTEDHLVPLVLASDADALEDLRRRALAPLAELPPAGAARLTETLRSWLLHQGRRNDVAADLHVHPQTVRYRMGQLRDLFGDRLTEPQAVLQLTLALALPDRAVPTAAGADEGDGPSHG